MRDFTVFFGRSPEEASTEDLRRYQHRMRTSGASAATMNFAVSAVRFFFGRAKPRATRPWTGATPRSG